MTNIQFSIRSIIRIYQVHRIRVLARKRRRNKKGIVPIKILHVKGKEKLCSHQKQHK